ncbi:hypothetical protein F8M41_025172 [Gigaspora margarita]|uniref:Uncharacterized protein n=1 Tax=Gigaspora margarita TaxID=4874 RepID=A0A8H3XKN4_GIGMA|nr:hypothetical protein F8M41_025172 [Gigaspora margarita]
MTQTGDKKCAKLPNHPKRFKKSEGIVGKAEFLDERTNKLGKRRREDTGGTTGISSKKKEETPISEQQKYAPSF